MTGYAMVKVLFIAGGGRTGSTMLHNVLGQIDGFAVSPPAAAADPIRVHP